ncbi:MAG: hypothetical protein WA873_08905 [Jannaschia helgolandensis]
MNDQVKHSDITLEWYKNNVQIARELSVFALKALMTLNSGAFVVLLTFIGNAANQSAFSISTQYLKTSMILFLVGIGMTFLTVAIAYINAMLFDHNDPKKGMDDKIAIPVYALLTAIGFGSFAWGVLNIVFNIQSST